MVVVEKTYYTLDEIAERLKVSRRTVNRWVVEGTLPAIRLAAQGGSVRVAESDLRNFLEERRTAPREEED
jgi:excisionase family DNA binding protein